MGIRGLSKVFEESPQLYNFRKLHDETVIFDGDNVMHTLYYGEKITAMHGGEFDRYTKAIEKYLSVFLKCNITPIFIFDGGNDPTDRKLRVLLRRYQERMNLANFLAEHGHGIKSENILPILAQDVFKQVLREKNIVFAQCPFEADEEITALANYYQCPIISQDSDFYIFNVRGGFIPAKSIRPKVYNSTYKRIPYSYLNCKIYHLDNFLSLFPRVEKNILPLFGILMGNDYVEADLFLRFKQFKGLTASNTKEKVVDLMNWFGHVTLEEGVSEILQKTSQENLDFVKSLIDRAVHDYNMRESKLVYVIEGRLEDLKSYLEKSLRTSVGFDVYLKYPCGRSVPTNFVLQFLLGTFPGYFLNAIILHSVKLEVQVENFDNTSSYACSKFLRRVIYGILLRHDSLESPCKAEDCLSWIKEYDRWDGEVASELVRPIYSLDNVGELPKLSDLESLGKAKSREILLSILEVEDRVIASIPRPWQLLFAATIHWRKKSSSHPNIESIYSLLVNIICYLDPTQNKAPDQKDPKICSLDDLCCLTTKINHSELTFASKNISKYLFWSPSLNIDPLIIDVMHSFSQFRGCLMYSSHLNKLLKLPFQEPVIRKLFSGSLLYNLAAKMLSNPKPDDFVSELLGPESTLNNLFKIMKAVIITPKESLDVSHPHQLPKRKRRKKVKKIGSINSLSSTFESLSIVND